MGGRDPAQANGACGCYPNAGTPTLSGTDDMIALALTDAVTVGVHSNGTGVAWGFTGYATNPSSTPTPVTAIPSLPSVVGVSAGPVHACAWTAAGAVWCWGTNVWGALGTGDFNGGSTCVPGSCSKVALAVSSLSAKRVSAGYDFTVAIGDHTAMAFGIDDVAELGHSLALDVTCNTNHKCAPSPTKVEGIPGTK